MTRCLVEQAIQPDGALCHDVCTKVANIAPIASRTGLQVNCALEGLTSTIAVIVMTTITDIFPHKAAHGMRWGRGKKKEWEKPEEIEKWKKEEAYLGFGTGIWRFGPEWRKGPGAF